MNREKIVKNLKYAKINKDEKYINSHMYKYFRENVGVNH